MIWDAPESVIVERDAVALGIVPVDVELELGVRGGMAWSQDPGVQVELWWSVHLGRFLSVADDSIWWS